MTAAAAAAGGAIMIANQLPLHEVFYYPDRNLYFSDSLLGYISRVRTRLHIVINFMIVKLPGIQLTTTSEAKVIVIHRHQRHQHVPRRSAECVWDTYMFSPPHFQTTEAQDRKHQPIQTR